MALDTSRLKHTFNIHETSLLLVPEGRSTFNEFDSYGLLLGLERLPGERNASYKKRLLDVYVHRASSTYTGLINGITRELGLEFYSPITITLQTGLDPALNPAIEFKQNKVYIYSDVVTGTLELTLDRSNPLLGAYTIEELIDQINNTGLYIATANPDVRDHTRSDCILNSSSITPVLSETLPTSSNFTVKHTKILPGTLGFSDLETFSEEVETEELVTSTGKYFVDYSSGFISSYSVPLGNSVVRYKYTSDPFIPTASPVIIRSIHSREFQTAMFNQIVAVDGTVSNGTPTDLGSEIINELLSVVPMYWGT